MGKQSPLSEGRAGPPRKPAQPEQRRLLALAWAEYPSRIGLRVLRQELDASVSTAVVFDLEPQVRLT